MSVFMFQTLMMYSAYTGKPNGLNTATIIGIAAGVVVIIAIIIAFTIAAKKARKEAYLEAIREAQKPKPAPPKQDNVQHTVPQTNHSTQTMRSDPSGKLGRLGIFICICSFVSFFGGFALLFSDKALVSQLGSVAVSSGVAGFMVGLALNFLADSLQYRNDLIKQEITVLQEVRKDIQSLKAKESSSDDQSNPETVQNESSDNL
jgi:hypothetical protein